MVRNEPASDEFRNIEDKEVLRHDGTTNERN